MLMGTGMLVAVVVGVVEGVCVVVTVAAPLLAPLVGAGVVSGVSEAEVTGVGVVLQDVLHDEELAVSLVSLTKELLLQAVEVWAAKST